MSAHLALGVLAAPVGQAAQQRSAQVTDLTARTAALAGLVLVVALVFRLLRTGWHRRAAGQADLPALPTAPHDPGAPRLAMTGRYHGSTTAGQWLDRIVAHGLGARSRAELTLFDTGLSVVRPGASDFFVPAGRLRGARLDRAIAGKVLNRDGLLVVTWEHGDRLIDSGFRSARAAEHPAWADALTALNHPHPSTEGALR